MRADHGRARRNPPRALVAALFAAIVLVAGTGLYVSAAPLVTGEGSRPVAAKPPQQASPSPSATPSPASSPKAAKPKPKPVPTVPETRKNVVRPRRCPAPPKVPSAAPATAAYPKGKALKVWTAPDGKVRATYANPSKYGFVPVFQVRRIQGEWALLHISERPNGSTGWAKVAELNLYQVDYDIVVELCAHRMTLYKSGKVVMQEAVAVGAPRWPTPTGTFFIDYHWETGRPRGGYGPWVLSIAGYSNVLTNFAGGVGQIAFHGTSAPWSVGKSVSHGCLRMHNEAIIRLQRHAVPGTPVAIVP